MIDPIEEARERINKLWLSSDEERQGIALAALDCLEAQRGPRFRCSGCGDESNRKEDLLTYHAKQTVPGLALCDGDPVDLHAKAWEKFVKTIGIIKPTNQRTGETT